MIFDRSRATAADALCQHHRWYLHYKNVRLKGLTEFSLGHHTTFHRESVENKQTPTPTSAKKHMKTLHHIIKNRAFTHMRILAAVLLVLTAAALMFIATSSPAAARQTTTARMPADSKVLHSQSRLMSRLLSAVCRILRDLCSFRPGQY